MKGRNMSTKVGRVTPAAVVIVALVFASPTFADIRYGFTGIVTSEADPAAVAILEAQMFVDVAEGPDANQVQFTFRNIDPDPDGNDIKPSIAGIYFDDGALLGLARVINDDDPDHQVDFSQGANPGELPRAEELEPPFETLADFLADSDPPTYHNGVGEGEWVTIVFDLQPDMGFADVIDFMSNGGLRIGIHVQAFDDDNSETATSNTAPVPTPSAAALGGLGFAVLSAVGWVKKRRAARSAA